VDPRDRPDLWGLRVFRDYRGSAVTQDQQDRRARWALPAPLDRSAPLALKVRRVTLVPLVLRACKDRQGLPDLLGRPDQRVPRVPKGRLVFRVSRGLRE
jgi:hypothetical protein